MDSQRAHLAAVMGLRGGVFAVGRGRVLGKGADQLGMICGAVIALAVVLPDQLPIGLFDDGRLEGNLGLMQFMRQKVRLDVFANRLEIRRLGGETNPDITADTRAVDRPQTMLRFVEFAAHVARRDQAAVERIGPLMVGADETRSRAVLRGADSRASVSAGVMEGVQRAFAVAHHQNRILADLYRQVVARIRDLAVVPHEQPVAIPDHFQIDLVILRAAIEVPLQGGFGITVPQSAQHEIARIHDGIPSVGGDVPYQYSCGAHATEATPFAQYTTAIYRRIT